MNPRLKMLRAALDYAKLGFHILPCQPLGKAPACPHGVKEATSDPARVASWWARRLFNIGISTEGLLVIDIDVGGLSWPGSEKAREIKQLKPPVQRTPRGGLHIFFRRPPSVAWRCSTGRLAPGVDVKTDGGYVLAAPSFTNKGAYQWMRPLSRVETLPFPPTWLREELNSISNHTAAFFDPRQPFDAPQILYEGQRNVGLTKVAGKLRRAGFSREEIEAILIVTNKQRCIPPLPESEVVKIAKSISRYPAGAALPRWFSGKRLCVMED